MNSGRRPDDREEELRALIARWQQPLFGFAWRYLRNSADAEEVVLEAFARFHEHRGGLRDPRRASAWLFATAANLCRNRVRWRRRHPEEAAPEGGLGAGERPSPEGSPRDIVQTDEAAASLRAAIDQLPADQKAALLLHEFQGVSCAEIAAIVGCSERGVETRIYRARRELRRRLARFLGEGAGRSGEAPASSR